LDGDLGKVLNEVLGQFPALAAAMKANPHADPIVVSLACYGREATRRTLARWSQKRSSRAQAHTSSERVPTLRSQDRLTARRASRRRSEVRVAKATWLLAI
jgi:hypothetical protein